jgi:hypothetical protein
MIRAAPLAALHRAPEHPLNNNFVDYFLQSNFLPDLRGNPGAPADSAGHAGIARTVRPSRRQTMESEATFRVESPKRRRQ